MNERIWQLANQSKVFVADSYGRRWELDPAKFAELIVRECAEIAGEFDHDTSDDYNSGRLWAESDILKHFGVE